jgi:MoxR-like ATPase
VYIKQYRGFTTNVLPVPEIYAPHIESLATIIKSEITGLKCLLVGDTGCGKTSLLEYYAACTGRPFFRQVWDESTDDQKLFGSLEVRTTESGAETYFNAAPLTRSMAFPAVAVMDELSAGTSSQTMLINPLLDRRQVTITTHDDTDSQVITAVDDWLVFATDNTAGNGDDLDLYNSRNILDQAIINRFDLYQKVPYAPESVERKLIKKFSDGAVSDDDAKKLAHFSALCHKGFSDRTITTAFSVRNLMAICALVKCGDTIQEAIKINYYTRVAKSEQADIAEMVRSVFG